jgi:hypothetical protein
VLQAFEVRALGFTVDPFRASVLPFLGIPIRVTRIRQILRLNRIAY